MTGKQLVQGCYAVAWAGVEPTTFELQGRTLSSEARHLFHKMAVDWHYMCCQLYDLMVMAVKYQSCMCKRPQDLLLTTLNHLDVIRQYSEGSKHHIELCDNVHNLLHNVRISKLLYVIKLMKLCGRLMC